MDVSEALKTAWEAVESADLPEKIQEVAFREAVRLIAPDQSSEGAPTSRSTFRGAPPNSAEGNTNGASPSVSEEDIYSRVTTHTGVDRDHLEQVAHLDGEDIKVSLPGLKLGKNNAERARAVAQILTVTRGFGLEETDTPLEVIRAECDRLKVYDTANFSSQIKALPGYVITGSGSNRRLRAKSGGIEAFPALVDALVGA